MRRNSFRSIGLPSRNSLKLKLLRLKPSSIRPQTPTASQVKSICRLLTENQADGLDFGSLIARHLDSNRQQHLLTDTQHPLGFERGQGHAE